MSNMAWARAEHLQRASMSDDDAHEHGESFGMGRGMEAGHRGRPSRQAIEAGHRGRVSCDRQRGPHGKRALGHRPAGANPVAPTTLSDWAEADRSERNAGHAHNERASIVDVASGSAQLKNSMPAAGGAFDIVLGLFSSRDAQAGTFLFSRSLKYRMPRSSSRLTALEMMITQSPRTTP